MRFVTVRLAEPNQEFIVPDQTACKLQTRIFLLVTLACTTALAEPGVMHATETPLPQGQLASPTAAEPVYSPYETLYHEEQTSKKTTNHAKENTTKSTEGGKPVAEGESQEESLVKSQTKVRLRSQRIYPQVDVRHATPFYDPLLDRFAGTPWGERIERRLREPVTPPAEHAAQRPETDDSPRRVERRRPKSHVLAYEEAPLRDVVQNLREITDIPIQWDQKSLEDAGIALDTPISVQVDDGTSLRAALRQLLDATDLTFIIANEVLLITTKEGAESDLQTIVYPVPFCDSLESLIDLIQNAVQPHTWDTQGGPGAMRAVVHRNELVISQTQEVHEEVAEFIRHVEEPLAAPSGKAVPDPIVLAYSLSRASKDAQLDQQLVASCNMALGSQADPAARVIVLGDKLFVHSASRPFHVMAAELIRSINGVVIETVEREPSAQSERGFGVQPFMNQGMGGMGGASSLCWVAREVYGTHDPRWLVFRQWMMTEAPSWLRHAYGQYGESIALSLRHKPFAKRAVRFAMDCITDSSWRQPGPTPGYRRSHEEPTSR